VSAVEPFVLVASGLAFEARLARGHGARVCCGQGPALASLLRRALSPECRGIISYGVAGGLAPDLDPGTIVVASTVVGKNVYWETASDWSRRLLAGLGGAVNAPLLAVDSPLIDEGSKRARFMATGAAAVDTESHIAAAVAAEAEVPFAVLRAIVDPVGRAIPKSALAAIQPDGSTRLGPVLATLVRHPRDTAALIRLAGDASIARRALAEARSRLGVGFGLLDCG
jgi:adenosylhomocysteine nucleosidase